MIIIKLGTLGAARDKCGCMRAGTLPSCTAVENDMAVGSCIDSQGIPLGWKNSGEDVCDTPHVGQGNRITSSCSRIRQTPAQNPHSLPFI